MGNTVSKNNKDHVNKNWSKLKCSPIGPFLQMLGIAPGNANDTSTKCKSSAFNSQFSSSMTDHANVSKKLTGSLGGIQNMLQKFRNIIASLEYFKFN
jgi:hypothetical protein